MKQQLTFDRSLFIDSSNLAEIKKWNSTGIIDGVTTNQLIMLKDGVRPSNVKSLIKAICAEMDDKPVSVELTDSTATEQEMLKEADKWNKIAKNIVIKVPLIPNTTKSLRVVKRLADAGIAVNITVMMTYEQMFMAILAARHCIKPSFVSIFYGRTSEDHERYRSRKDFGAKGSPTEKVGPVASHNSTAAKIVAETARFLKEGNYTNPKIIVGSIRHAAMVGEAFAAGGNIITVTPPVLTALLHSQRSIETIIEFDNAWKEMQNGDGKNSPKNTPDILTAQPVRANGPKKSKI